MLEHQPAPSTTGAERRTEAASARPLEAPTLAALFGTGPFELLESFDPDASREQLPVRDAVEF